MRARAEVSRKAWSWRAVGVSRPVPAGDSGTGGLTPNARLNNRTLGFVKSKKLGATGSASAF